MEGQGLRATVHRLSDSGSSPGPWGAANRSAQKVFPDTLPSISLAQFHPFDPNMLFYEDIQRRTHLSLINPQVILKSSLKPRTGLKAKSTRRIV